jgi:hypothetical protein
MNLTIVNHDFCEVAYITKPIDLIDAINNSPKFFDKDGYELTPIEQMYHEANGIDISERHLYHTANHRTWFSDEESSTMGAVLDHSLLATRSAYDGEAREQLERVAKLNPLISKLLSIRPKWGFDISIDYVCLDQCIELFHIEYDFDCLDKAKEAKQSAESRIIGIDWNDCAERVLQQKSKWAHLNSDDQADWKAKYFGWDRAFENLKVFT